MSIEDLLLEALKLPEIERLMLATRLLESLPETADGLDENDPHLFDKPGLHRADLADVVRAEENWQDS